MLLLLSCDLFDEGPSGPAVVDVFIDVLEKTLGAAPGTMGFIRQFIR